MIRNEEKSNPDTRRRFAASHPASTRLLHQRRLLAGGLLLLAMGLFFALLQVPPPWKLGVGEPGDSRFLAGFFAPEQHHGTAFRWSGPDARLMLHGAGTSNMTLDMHMFGARHPTSSNGQHLRLAHEETTFAAFTLPADEQWRVYRVLLPPQAVADSDASTAPLELRADTYRPGADDGRDLGVPLDWVRIAPLPPTPPFALRVALLRALALVWSLGVLTALLIRLAGVLLPHPSSDRQGIIAALLTGGAALTLAVWVAINPYTLTWALPNIPWTLGLLTLVLLLTTPALRPRRAMMQAASSSLRPAHTALLLALVAALALALRLYHIDSLPYGLWRDEARHGLIALRILEDPGYQPTYVARGGVNMPALGFYPFALALKLWGIHPWSMRVMTALAGALTVLPLYALVRRLFGRPDVALLAATFLAIASWHISISRFSFPSIFEPLLALSGLWLLLLALESQSPQRCTALRPLLAALAGGACLGMAAQMYHTGRVVPVVAGALALLWLWQARHHWRHWLVVAAACTVGFALAAAPLVSYALRHPDSFNDRVGGVFLLSQEARQAQAPLEALDESLGRHLIMFNLRGDSNGRHHAPDQPLLDVVTGAGFLVGFVVLLRHWRDWRSLWLFAALLLGTLPSLLAVEGPHAMRSIGAAPYACIIAAIGWQRVARLVHKIGEDGPLFHAAPPALLRSLLFVLVLALTLALNVRTYFVTMAYDSRVWTAFYPVHTQIGSYVREFAETHGPDALTDVYVPRTLARNDVFAFLTHGLPVQTFRSEGASPSVPPDARLILSGYTYQRDIAELDHTLDPAAEPVARGPDLPGTDNPSFFVYEAP